MSGNRVNNASLPFLRKGGECAEYIRLFDWSNHPLGPPEGWPVTLKTSLGILLNSGFPKYLFWGDDHFCFYNDAFRPTLGFIGNYTDSLGKPGRDVWGEAWQQIENQIKTVKTKGSTIKLDGQPVPENIKAGSNEEVGTYSYSPVIDPDGMVVGVLVLCFATSAEMKVSEDLRKLNSRLLRAKEIGKLGYWSYHLDEGKLEWSDKLYELWGVDPDRFIPEFETILERVHQDDRKFFVRANDAITNRIEEINFKHRIIHDDGSVSWMHQRAEINKDSDGRVVFEGVTQDVTDSQFLNLELHEKARELERTNKELEDFAYTASHDMREPLRMISSFMDLLERKYGEKLDEKALGYIGFAKDGARRIAAMINDLLEFSRIGRVYSDQEEVDLNEIIQDVIGYTRVVIDESEGEIIVDPLPKVKGVSLSLKLLFQNLIMNALKYSREGVPPKIEIAGKKLADEWQISVIDNGIGISEEYFEEIFNLYRRLHTNEGKSGSGIGLAICKKIVEQHQGRIWVESSLGSGSTFHFTIKSS
ncbi:MAG: PAS domain-containing protein [Balneolaceae bacterium]|nr:PAS domain-containing protein [Balneolaceae bacterium]MCH8549551.1 PAS domain-containing protein [Balneolaceae bacterium]